MKKFLMIWSGELISSIGSGMTAFALSVYVYQITGSAIYVSLITLLAYLPTVLLSPLGGVPVILLDEFDIALGDKITLNSGDISKTFTVKSYVYDGQMNSTLCSSTRFLISDEDFDALLGNVGETEYLIEAYFADSSLADDYQTAYEQSEKNLPKNGQAITYTMIFLLSALTDLMMAMVFVLTGVLLIAIAVVCLRYVVLAQLEDDMREIGTMKAIGIPQQLIDSMETTLTDGYSIENMEKFVGQTLGGVSAQVRQSAYAVFFIGITLTVLIVTLFMKLKIARKGGTLAAKMTMGIPFTAICRQELYPVLIAGGLGTFAGVNFLQYLVIPVLLLAVLTGVTWGICRSIRKIKIENYFND